MPRMVRDQLNERPIPRRRETTIIPQREREWNELEQLLSGIIGRSPQVTCVPGSMNQREAGYPTMVSVIVLVESTDLQQTQRFLRDLTGGTRRIGQMILVPCGVTPAMLAWLRAEKQRQTHWLLLEENNSPIEAWTSGARHAGGDLICFARDGLVVPEYLLEGLEEVMTKSVRAGIVAPVIFPGAAGEEPSVFPARFRERNRFRRIRAQSLGPACFLLRRDVWEAAGGFGVDEDGPADLAARVAMLGLEVIVAGDIALIWKTIPADVTGYSLPLIHRRFLRLRAQYSPSSVEPPKLHALSALACDLETAGQHDFAAAVRVEPRPQEVAIS